MFQDALKASRDVLQSSNVVRSGTILEMKLRKNYSKQKEPKIVISTRGKSNGCKEVVVVSAVVEMTYKQAPPSAAELARSYLREVSQTISSDFCRRRQAHADGLASTLG